MTVAASFTSRVTPVVDAISILMAWRTLGGFRARVHFQLGADPPRKYDLEARTRELSYRLVDVESGQVDSFDGESRELVEADKRVEYRTHLLVFEPLPARLAFPLSLGIWGRSFDDYRISYGEDEGDNIVLSLVNTRASDVTGTLTVSRTERKAMRLDTPTQQIRYESVEPLGVG